MYKCCAEPPADLATFVKGEKTCKVNTGTLKIFNFYSLNKHQDDKMGNNITWGDKMRKGLGKDAVRNICIVQFNVKSFLLSVKVFRQLLPQR